MKSLRNVCGIFILITVFITSCPEPGNDGLGKNIGQGIELDDIDINDISSGLNMAVRAQPLPKSTLGTYVYDSYAETKAGVTTNFYFIDVGVIRHMYISTISNIRYNGMTPLSYSRTSTTETSISNNIKETISTSIKITDVNKHKVDISASLEGIPVIGKWFPKASYAWEGQKTKENIKSDSIEKSLTEAEKQSKSETVSYTIGSNGEPAGWHRVALYADFDVYFIVKTSADKKELLGWETVFSVREDSFYLSQEFSPDGIFDTSPLNDITFAEDFYKYLPDPGVTDITPPIPDILTSFITIRSGEKTITDSGRFNQPFDTVSFKRFGINLSELKTLGYKTVSFTILMDYYKDYSGTQYLFIYNSPTESANYLIATHTWSWTAHKWHYNTRIEFNNISIDKFLNEFVIRYGASGDGWDDWRNKNIRVQLLIKT